MRSNRKKESKNKKDKNGVILYGLIVIMLIVSASITYLCFKKPLQLKQVTDENKAQQKTSFDYKVDVMPTKLYPDGGLITPEGPIYPKLIRSVNVHINTAINSKKPVDISGSQKVNLTVVAENYWQKDYVLSQEKSFNVKGTGNTIMNNDFTVNLAEISDFIDEVAKETNISADKYIIKVKPEFTGSIMYKDKKVPIDNSQELTFELNYSEFKQTGDKVFNKDIDLGNYKIIENSFDILSIPFPIVFSRIIFSLISILLLIITIIKGISYRKTLIDSLTEAQIIDRRYGRRLIPLKYAIGGQGRLMLLLESFKSLIDIADERELNILKYDDKEGLVIYYVIDSNCIYYYEIRTITFDVPVINYEGAAAPGK